MKIMEIHREHVKKNIPLLCATAPLREKNLTMETWRSWRTNQEITPAPLTQSKKQPVQK
jgi:hypothetical protein